MSTTNSIKILKTFITDFIWFKQSWDILSTILANAIFTCKFYLDNFFITKILSFILLVSIGSTSDFFSIFLRKNMNFDTTKLLCDKFREFFKNTCHLLSQNLMKMPTTRSS